MNVSENILDPPVMLDNYSNITVFTSPHVQLNYLDRKIMVATFSVLTGLAFVLNGVVLGYIIVKRLYRNFVSSHFIGHLMLTDMFVCGYLIPIFIHNLNTDANLFEYYPLLCRFQAFVTTCLWSVVFYMSTCIAGVHLLTFARFHYDQLFGLPPTLICIMSWLIGISLGLPCLTNSDIVGFQPTYYHCLWRDSSAGHKFLAYVVLLGLCLPFGLTWYAYIKVLAIFYHSPVVFQALGLYKSRWLVYGFVISPLCQLPFFISRFVNPGDAVFHPICMFLAYAMCIVNPIIYGTSLFLMKEEDMSLLSKSHPSQPTRGGPYTAGVAHNSHEL